jgi:molybdopterin/thiamine biosynthesis adenylyltransferase
MTAFARAKAAVAAWLGSLGGAAVAVDAADLADRYPERGFAFGWRLAVTFPDQVRRLELLLPIGFPWQPPRVALLDRPPFLTWPHVEKDGVLCLAPNTLEIDPGQPVKAVAFMLMEAEGAVTSFSLGACDADFRDEFATYWQWGEDTGPRVISLLRAEPPTRLVRLWRGKPFYLIGETDAELRQWLLNVSAKLPERFDTIAAGLLWLGKPPIPCEYPTTGTSLRALLHADGVAADEVLLQLAHEQSDRVFVGLGVDTANGPALGGVIIPSPPRAKHGARDPLTKGFRPGLVPDATLLARYFGGTAILRRSMERADSAWIHGRGQDPRAVQLGDKCVVVIGCGSVGGAVAVALAQAGVGHIVLIDPDRLAWANVGRHVLGVKHVNQYKAEALAAKLRADFPHAKIEFHAIDADTAVRRHSDVLRGADLVLALTGSWAADSRLDAWHAEIGRVVPIVYGWTESHACAGHAISLVGPDACLQCGFDGAGAPAFRVTDWPDGAGTRQEPACGAVFQPYGPVELSYINSLVGELSLDVLLGEESSPIHRVWVGNGKRVNQLSGTWSAAWQADPQFRDRGGFIAQRAWPQYSCSACTENKAA